MRRTTTATKITSRTRNAEILDAMHEDFGIQDAEYQTGFTKRRLCTIIRRAAKSGTLIWTARHIITTSHPQIEVSR